MGILELVFYLIDFFVINKYFIGKILIIYTEKLFSILQYCSHQIIICKFIIPSI